MISANGSYNSDGTPTVIKSATVDGTLQAVNTLVNYAAAIYDGAELLAKMKHITYGDALRTIETALHFIDTAELKNEINPNNFIERK